MGLDDQGGQPWVGHPWVVIEILWGFFLPSLELSENLHLPFIVLLGNYVLVNILRIGERLCGT